MVSGYMTPPAVYIVFGLPGSGKSYFASRWAKAINAAYVNSDQVRKQLYEHPTYSVAEKNAVYQYMMNEMKKAIAKGDKIVLDATFSNNDIRKTFEKEGADKASVRYIEITADEAVIRDRLKEVRRFSDADFNVYVKIREEWHELHKPHLVLQSTPDNVGDMIMEAKKYFGSGTG